METLLTTQNLSVGYKSHAILSNINISIEKGEVISLLGANGIGKSTMLKTLIGELPPISGNIFIKEKNISSISQKLLSKLIAIVTTDKVQAGGLKVHELVKLGRHPHTGFFGKLSDIDIEVAQKAMNAVGIAHKENAFLSELSDGERQKAMIARAIAQQTPLIILDEPFSFLDTASRIEILSLLKQISRQNQVGILLSSHDVSQAMRMSDRIILIDKNRQIFCGTPTQAVESSEIQNLFANDKITYDSIQSDFIIK